MGLFDFIANKKKQKEETETKRIADEECRLRAEHQKIAEEAEKKRLLEIEQAKNRAALDLLCSGDNERYRSGVQWMLKNEGPILKASITKIGKETKDNYYSTPYGIKVSDVVSFDDSFDYDDNGNDKSKIIVSYESGEIGELSKVIRDKLGGNDINSLIGIVAKVDDDDDFKISVAIFEGSEFSEPGYRQLHTYIAGTKYENTDGSSRQEFLSHTFGGERIKLVKSEYNGEPSVMVCKARDFQLGFLKVEIAKEFSDKLDRGQIGGVYVSKVSEIEGFRYCDIVINIAKF